MSELRVPDRDRFGWQDPVIDKDLTAPPGSPSEGDRYIVAATATGDWATHEDEIAEYNGSAWEFYAPSEGWRVDVIDEDAEYRFSGSTWEVPEANGQQTYGFKFTSTSGPYVQESGTSYTVAARFVFCGTDSMGVPASAKTIVWRNTGSNLCGARLYDLTNSLVIAEITDVDEADPTLRDMGTLSNVPTGEAMLELQIKGNTGASIRVSALALCW